MDIYYHKTHYWFHKKNVLMKMTAIKVEVCYGCKTPFLTLFQLGTYNLTFMMGWYIFPPELKKCIEKNDRYLMSQG